MELDGQLSDKEISELNDSKIAIQSVFEGMARFYLHNQPLLRTDCPKLQLMHRIASCMDIALEQNGAGDLYAADLIHIDEQLNIGLRGRCQNRNLLVMDFSRTHLPDLKQLAALCGEDGARYRIGVSIRLKRNSYRLTWQVPQNRLGLELGWYFDHCSDRAHYLEPDPSPVYAPPPKRIGW